MIAISPRQRQIVDGLWNGKMPREMAIVLGISDSSVHTHLAELRRKTGAMTTYQMLRVLVKKRLLKP